MQIEDIKLVCRAIEMAYHGVDISTVTDFSQYYNPVKGKFQSKASPHTKPITLRLSQEVIDYVDDFCGNCVIRSKPTSAFFCFEDALTDEEKETIVDVSLKIFKETMVILVNNSITSFNGIDPTTYDENYAKRLEESKNIDYTVTPRLPMMETLSRDAVRQNFEVLLTLFQYPEQVTENMFNQYNHDNTDFEIEVLKDFKIIDNRMYIPLSLFDIHTFFQNYNNTPPMELGLTKYIVISRNPYDYFFSSYGSSIQSCYSLNSDFNGGYGMFTMCTLPGHFLVYGTDGKSNQCAIINGKKWEVPHMTFRSWGWLSKKGNLMCDRFYVGSGGGEEDFLNRFYTPILEKHFKVSKDDRKDSYTILKYGTEYVKYYETHKLQMYVDSVQMQTNGKFRVYGGCRTTIGTQKPPFRKFIDLSKTITNVPESFTYCKRFSVVKGTLTPLKLCPVTQLPICEEESTSFYAKFYKEPVKNLTVVTYCDGIVWLTETSLTHDIINKDSGKGVCIYTKDPVTHYGDLPFTEHSGKLIRLSRKISSEARPISLTVFKNTLKEVIQVSPGVDNILLRVIEQDRVNYIKYKG